MMRCGTAQCSAVCSMMRCGPAQCSAVCSMMRCGTAQCSAVCSMMRYGTAQCSAAGSTMRCGAVLFPHALCVGYLRNFFTQKVEECYGTVMPYCTVLHFTVQYKH
jgi:hypothetical protein